MPLWATILIVLAAIAAGIPLSIFATAHLRRNRKSYAIASALLFSFGMYNPNAEKIAETRDEGEHAGRQKSGDPPTSG